MGLRNSSDDNRQNGMKKQAPNRWTSKQNRTAIRYSAVVTVLMLVANKLKLEQYGDTDKSIHLDCTSSTTRRSPLKRPFKSTTTSIIHLRLHNYVNHSSRTHSSNFIRLRKFLSKSKLEAVTIKQEQNDVNAITWG